MQRSRWCIPYHSNGTNCTATKLSYPTRIFYDLDFATKTSLGVAGTKTILLAPQEHFMSSLADTLNGAGSFPSADAFDPLKSLLSTVSQASSSVASTSSSTTSETDITSTVTPTITRPTAVAANPSSLGTATTSTRISTPVNAPTETNTTPSVTPVSGVQQHNTTGLNRGAVAGGVIAAVAVAVIIFAIVVCCRKKSRRSAGSASNPTWKQIEQAEKAEILAIGRNTRNTVNGANTKHFNTHQTTIPRASSANTLGEPGPSFDMDDNQRGISLCHPSLRIGHRYIIGNRKGNSDISNPFATPTESNQDTDSSLDADEPTRSQIGLALSRYSTNTLKHDPSPFQHEEMPALPQSPLMISLNEKAKANTEDKHTASTDTVNHKRASSVSALTDGAEGEIPVITVAKAITARRHSLGPRMIDIIAGTSHSDGGQRVSRAISRSDNDLVRKSLNRTRSASPAVTVNRYTGSPAKLNGHFGIETWGMEPGRTSSENSAKHNTDGTPTDVVESGMDRQSSTKSSIYGREYVGAVEHRRYPPTSFPMIDRSLSQAKRRLREQSTEILGKH